MYQFSKMVTVILPSLNQEFIVLNLTYTTLRHVSVAAQLSSRRKNQLARSPEVADGSLTRQAPFQVLQAAVPLIWVSL